MIFAGWLSLETALAHHNEKSVPVVYPTPHAGAAIHAVGVQMRKLEQEAIFVALGNPRA